jgi:hypothetical protein
MQSASAYRPLNRWSNDRISPGQVASVGDVMPGIRLKQSQPDLDPRFDNQFVPLAGINDTDGRPNGARTYDDTWSGSRGFKTNIGYVIQDLVQPDTSIAPYLSSIGDYSWRNKVANTFEARRTGSNFLPLPGEYRIAQGEIQRGGNVPEVTNIEGIQGIEQGVVSRGSVGEGISQMEERNRMSARLGKERATRTPYANPPKAVTK